MATAKIRIKVGEIEVDYEGSETFLNKQLPGLVEKLSQLTEKLPPSKKKGGGHVVFTASGTLASFLREKNATGSQRMKFLATAEWLHRKGSKHIKTGDVTAALREAQQTRLGNPADCLNKNVAQGYCEKNGSGFFVTDEGRTHLG